MIYQVIIWFLLIIYVEAVTEIIVNGAIFDKLRHKIFELSEFLHSLVSCGYCTSVWVSATAAWLAPGDISGYLLVDYIIKLFVLHRLSNFFHEINTRWFKRIPWTISLHKTVSDFTPQIELGEEDELER